MGTFGKIVAGIGMLIAVFLFLNNADATAKIISTFAINSTQGIKVLQGRG